jgi:hypothetical protein
MADVASELRRPALPTLADGLVGERPTDELLKPERERRRFDGL